MTILRDLITEAMEMKVKRQQEQQRELEEEDDNSVSLVFNIVLSIFLRCFDCFYPVLYSPCCGCSGLCRLSMCVTGGGGGGGLAHHGEVWLRKCWHHESDRHYEWWRSDHDWAWQHHAGVRPGHHGHQQRRGRRGWRRGLDEEWVLNCHERFAAWFAIHFIHYQTRLILFSFRI